jgi:hypothetical protein
MSYLREYGMENMFFNIKFIAVKNKCRTFAAVLIDI